MKRFGLAFKNIFYRYSVEMAVGYFMMITGFISIHFLLFSIPIVFILNIIYLCLSDKIYKKTKLNKRRIAGIFIILLMFSTLSTGFIHNRQEISIPVLTYHRVNNETLHSAVPTVTVRSFDKQMKFLKNHGYTTITEDELIKYYSGEKVNLPKKPVLITFDDGWEDNYTKAFQILKKYNFTATIFLATGRINTKNYMSWDMIREMKEYGISFGGHTKNHVNLKKVSIDEAYNEIKECYDDIARNLNINPKSFCYPYGGGDLSPSIQKLAKEAGFDIAFASHNYGINIGKANKFAVRRILMPRFRIFHKSQLIFVAW